MAMIVGDLPEAAIVLVEDAVMQEQNWLIFPQIITTIKYRKRFTLMAKLYILEGFIKNQNILDWHLHKSWNFIKLKILLMLYHHLLWMTSLQLIHVRFSQQCVKSVTCWSRDQLQTIQVKGIRPPVMMILLPPNSEREIIIRADCFASSWNGYFLKEFNQDGQM